MAYFNCCLERAYDMLQDTSYECQWKLKDGQTNSGYEVEANLMDWDIQ